MSREGKSYRITFFFVLPLQRMRAITPILCLPALCDTSHSNSMTHTLSLVWKIQWSRTIEWVIVAFTLPSFSQLPWNAEYDDHSPVSDLFMLLALLRDSTMVPLCEWLIVSPDDTGRNRFLLSSVAQSLDVSYIDSGDPGSIVSLLSRWNEKMSWYRHTMFMCAADDCFVLLCRIRPCYYYRNYPMGHNYSTCSCWWW